MIRTIRSYKTNQTFWEPGPVLRFGEVPDNENPVVLVQTDRTYQTHMGFGGAFTEAAAVTFSAAEKYRDEIVAACFGADGLRYNLGRTVIHSSDFSPGNRTYVTDDDRSLSTFSIESEHEHVLPLIKAAQSQAGKLWLFASPWSPPAFMKTNGELHYGGKLRSDCYDVWADYFVRYLKAMQEAGVKIEAVTTQNEPEATQVWESCRFDAEDELRLVNHLHAAFEREKMDVKILIWDHNRDRVVERADAILRKIPEKVWGVGYHWYMGEDAENLAVVHDLYPNHHLLFTEGCVELTHTAAGLQGDGKDKWKNAEFYGRNIIKDSLNYSEGFVDWNLLLNEQGGPNHVGNYCEAPLMYDRERDALIYNPSYYYIGHFSRFIEPGAVRVHVNASKDPALFATAYKNPDGEVVVVIQNEGWIKQRTLVVDGKRVEISLPPFSISTFVVVA